MSTFDELQADLGAARAEAEQRGREVVEGSERLHRLRRDRDLAARGGPPDALDQLIGEQEDALGTLRTEVDQLRLKERDLLDRFRDFSDPRQNLGRLTDRIPICLFPLRIEYRFKKAGEPGGPAADELWVRVYPDDISVDSFEHTLTETEAQDARTYWSSVWSAGGDEAGRRGAWKALLAGQGAGRSFWVTETYAPINPADQPVPPAADPWIILSIPTREPLVGPELSAVRTYWTAVWRAADDLTALGDADDDLEAAVGASRAEELRQGYSPRNLAAGPPAGATRAQTTVLVAFLHFPTDEDARLRLHGWSTTPRARLLPDRLVLLGFRGGQQVLEAIGEPVPATLAVAPDPSAAEEDQLRPDGAGMHVGPELEWVTDFERAIEQGMGFRIPLQSVDATSGFDELIVLGTRLRSDPEASRVALEELIEHHHHAKGGFSVLPQGHPTNNSDGDRSAYRWIEDSDISFDHYFGTAPPDPTDWFAKSDGRWLAEMLGLDPAALSTVPFYGRTDIADAKAMNLALWPGTLGYFLESMLHPIVEDDTIRRTRDFFVRHVTGRGTIPAIRVGKQPYGILPSAPRSRLQWFPRKPGRGEALDGPFLQQLYGHLRTMEADVAPLLDRVSYVGKPGDRSPAGAARGDRPAPGVGGVPAAVRRVRDRALQPDAARRRRGGVPGDPERARLHPERARPAPAARLHPRRGERPSRHPREALHHQPQPAARRPGGRRRPVGDRPGAGLHHQRRQLPRVAGPGRRNLARRAPPAGGVRRRHPACAALSDAPPLARSQLCRDKLPAVRASRADRPTPTWSRGDVSRRSSTSPRPRSPARPPVPSEKGAAGGSRSINARSRSPETPG